MSIFIQALLAVKSVPLEMYVGKTVIPVWSYFNNPFLPDTDFDGIDDDKDTASRNNSFKGDFHYSRKKKSMTSRVEFSVDYWDFFEKNETYSKDISVFSPLLAADIYSDVDIKVTDGATGG